MADLRMPWDFHEELDTAESFPYFLAYRNAKGSRQLNRIRFSVWERGARPRSTPTLDEMRTWYIRGRWAERALAWDGHLDAIAQQETEIQTRQTAADMATRHRNLFALQHAVVAREWEKLAGEAERDDSVLPARTLISATDSLVKQERLHYGEATERVEGMEGLTDAELDDIEEKLQKRARKE